MYKNLLHFSIFILIGFVLLSICILINADNKILLVNPDEYPEILDEIHSNIDKYVNKKISVSGYVYIQDDFSENYFVIAQNVIMDSQELIIGFLCENNTNIPVHPYEDIKITGKIEKCIYNGLQYPVIKITEIT